MAEKIYTVISEVMSSIGAIKKDQRNDTQRFAYRGVDQVMNALSPLLSKHHLLIVPEVLSLDREERQSTRGGTLMHTIATVKYMFYADDGSHVSAVVAGEGMDSGDKSTAKALSIAYKYACFQIFCIPTEEVVDPDRDSYQVAPRSQVDRIGQKEIDRLQAACRKYNKSFDLALSAVKRSDPADITYREYDFLMSQMGA